MAVANAITSATVRREASSLSDSPMARPELSDLVNVPVYSNEPQKAMLPRGTPCEAQPVIASNTTAISKRIIKPLSVKCPAANSDGFVHGVPNKPINLT